MKGVTGMVGQAMSRTGVVFFGLCCLGFAPLLGFLSAIGAGFLINDLFLIPLFIISLSTSLWGLKKKKQLHGNEKPFLLAVVLSISAVIFLLLLPLITYLSIAGLVAIYIWDFFILHSRQLKPKSLRR